MEHRPDGTNPCQVQAPGVVLHATLRWAPPGSRRPGCHPSLEGKRERNGDLHVSIVNARPLLCVLRTASAPTASSCSTKSWLSVVFPFSPSRKKRRVCKPRASRPGPGPPSQPSTKKKKTAKQRLSSPIRALVLSSLRQHYIIIVCMGIGHELRVTLSFVCLLLPEFLCSPAYVQHCHD